jgi:hypothetical protein
MYPEYHNDMIIIFKILPKKKNKLQKKKFKPTSVSGNMVISEIISSSLCAGVLEGSLAIGN